MSSKITFDEAVGATVDELDLVMRERDDLREEAKALSNQIAVTNLEMAEWSKRALNAEAENERLRVLETIVREHYADPDLGYLLQEWLSHNWQRA
jgi:hypothetical protein